jgi:hypothetical protein
LSEAAETAKSGGIEAGNIGEFLGGLFAGAYKGLLS